MKIQLKTCQWILIFALSALSLCGCEKDKLDKQMAELCRKDGGIKIHGTVTLSPEYFDQSGSVKTSTQQVNGELVNIIAEKYIATAKVTTLKAGDPIKGEGSLDRIYTSLVRIEDEKILAESVQYLRAGGDGFYWGHHTQKACPNYPMELNDKVFIQKTGGK